MNALCETLADAGYATIGLPPRPKPWRCCARSDSTCPDRPADADIDRHHAAGAEAQAVDPDLLGIVMTGHAAIDTAIEAMKGRCTVTCSSRSASAFILPVLARALNVRRMRIEIAQLQQRLREHVNRTGSREQGAGSFSYSVSHDLRAPLRASAATRRAGEGSRRRFPPKRSNCLAR